MKNRENQTYLTYISKVPPKKPLEHRIAKLIDEYAEVFPSKLPPFC